MNCKKMHDQFEYMDMWKHYVDKVGTPTDDIFVRVLTRNHQAKKLDKDGKVRAFLNRSMDAFVLDKNDPMILKYPSLFEFGAFVMADKRDRQDDANEREKSVRKKNLFIVTPRKHADDFFSADHFSFMLNKGQEKSLHFHETKYYPNIHDEIGNVGRVAHLLNHLPKSFEFVERNKIRWINNDGLQKEGPFVNRELTSMQDPLYDMFTRHLYSRDSRNHDYQKISTIGGGKKPRYLKKITLMSLEISDMFRTLPIDKVIVIGIKKSSMTLIVSKFDVTIVFVDRLYNNPSHMMYAFVVTMSENDMRDDETLEMEITRCMQGKSHYDFKAYFP